MRRHDDTDGRHDRSRTDTPTSLAAIPGTLVLVGAGKMGGAMLDGWLGLKLPPKKVVVLEPQPRRRSRRWRSAASRINPKGKIGPSAALVIAVKPQVAPEALPPLAPLVGPKTVVVSIMAGTDARVPRTGAAGRRDRARHAEHAGRDRPRHHRRGRQRAGSSAAARKLAHALLAATGAVEWVDDEALMDAVTAVSGSGPAYVFLLAEALARAGVAAGLPPALADQLARATVAGSGELLHRSALDAATLRTNVTSPGGTTAAALDVLMAADGLEPLLTKAVAAATQARRGNWRVEARASAARRALERPRCGRLS